jgi:hypothetical protein
MKTVRKREREKGGINLKFCVRVLLTCFFRKERIFVTKSQESERDRGREGGSERIMRSYENSKREMEREREREIRK